MGLLKKHELEARERGYDELSTFVCEECVGDDFLKSITRAAVNKLGCSYCGRTSGDPIAAPAMILIDHIYRAVRKYFDDPDAAGVPYDGGYVMDSTHLADILDDLGLACHDSFHEDIVSAFHNQYWVSAPGGHWASSEESDVFTYSWATFSNKVQHECRFFFSVADSQDDYDPNLIDAQRMLPTLGKLIQDVDLIRPLANGQILYRARQKPSEIGWEPNAQTMGSPPAPLARAGRMNPAGISYLYLAFDQRAALAEVFPGAPSSVVTAQFAMTREIHVLDLCALPALPSRFDADRKSIREALLFLGQFVKDISMPVTKDGREHIEYVPSQIVCEYFALSFRAKNNNRIDGIVYPSAILPGGRNVVLFPTARGYQSEFDSVRFSSSTDLVLGTWDDVIAALQSWS